MLIPLVWLTQNLIKKSCEFLNLILSSSQILSSNSLGIFYKLYQHDYTMHRHHSSYCCPHQHHNVITTTITAANITVTVHAIVPAINCSFLGEKKKTVFFFFSLKLKNFPYGNSKAVTGTRQIPLFEICITVFTIIDD